jgi:hypothetical protein
MKKPKIASLVLILAGFFGPCWQALAQNYLPARVVWADGSTGTGGIRSANWINTPQVVDFRAAGGDTRRLGVDALRSFEITRKDGKTERYERKIVSLNRSTDDLSTLEFGPTPRMELDTVFLQVLAATDRASLLSMEEPNKRHFFLENDSIVALVYKRYRKDDGSVTLYENNRYRQQWLAFAYACPDMKPQVLKANYQQGDFLRLFKAYAKCQGEPIKYVYEGIKTRLRLYAGVAAMSTTMYDVTFNRALYENARMGEGGKPTFSPFVGISLPFARSNGKLSIDCDLSYRHTKYSIEVDRKIIKGDNVFSLESTPEARQLAFNTQLRWRFWQKNAWATHLSGGVFNHILLDSKYYNSLPHDFGPVLGTGVGWQRFRLDLRYSLSRGFSGTNLLGGPLQTFSGFVSYNF